jgi:alpha-ketoglutarate-dependent taurine dioxygenase
MEQIEDIYPLSPTQQGILFHCLYSQEAGLYTSQWSYAIHRDFNAEAFALAWQNVIERHSIFRTAFVWEGLDESVQVAFRSVKLPLTQEDWSGLSGPEQEQRLEAFLRADRLRGFEFSKAPLLRLTLIKLTDAAHHFIWTYHHLLMDGWSESLVLGELSALYWSSCRNQPAQLEPSRPYGSYIAWLRRQDLSKAEAFWRTTLDGFTKPTRLGTDPTASAQKGGDARRVRLAAEATSKLMATARRHQLTLNTLIQGAWALLLSHLSGERDIVFGTTVSGRPAELPGVESMVGLFINTLPVRVRVEPEESLLSWLKRIQERQAEMLRYEYSPLVQIQEWSDVPRGVPLFETILVFQNTPINGSQPEQPERRERLELSNVRFDEGKTNFALSLDVEPGRELSLNISFESGRFDASLIEGWLESLEALLRAFVDHLDVKLNALQLTLDDLERQRQVKKEQELGHANLRKLGSVKRRALQVSPAGKDVSPAGKESSNGDAPPAALAPPVGARRKSVGASQQSWVTEESLAPDASSALLMQPAIRGVDLSTWARNNRAFIEERLLRHGAILFRNFDVKTVSDFEKFIAATSKEVTDYNDRSSPRSRLSESVYTSTDHPPDQSIFLHNENSYSSTWPLKIFFHCVTPALQGGETPIADCRGIFRRIDPSVRQLFIRKQVMYVRNFGDGFGLPWQSAFQTNDRKVVETFCREAGIECEWKEGQRLRTRQVHPAIARHPYTGDVVWFNQAPLFHLTSLEPSVRAELTKEFAEEDLPINSYFGDGSVIEEWVLEELKNAYRQQQLVFPWRQGDILLLDNMLMAHGRMPYSGARKIVVGMADPLGWKGVDLSGIE